MARGIFFLDALNKNPSSGPAQNALAQRVNDWQERSGGNPFWAGPSYARWRGHPGKKYPPGPVDNSQIDRPAG